MSPLPRYALDYGGRRFDVESEAAGWGAVGRLFVDGEQIAEGKSSNQKIILKGGGLVVVVRLNWMERVTEVLAVPEGTDPKRADVEGMAFTPPAGSRAARLDRMKREHPTLYAARHIALAIGQVLIGVLGIGALLGALLPRIDLPEIRLPALPTIPWPELPDIPWPTVPLPDIKLPPLPEVPFLDQLAALWSSLSWLTPIVIALIVAVNEVRKRRQREAADTARRRAAAETDTLPLSNR